MCGDGVMDGYPWVLSFAHEQRRPRGLRSAMIVWRGVAREGLQESKLPAGMQSEHEGPDAQVRGAECVVMAGDPKQLPPTLTSDGALDAQLDRTLFDRLQDTGQPLPLLNSMPGTPATALVACAKAVGLTTSRILLGCLQGPDEAPAASAGRGCLQHGDWGMG